jgi:hypothetical protein
MARENVEEFEGPEGLRKYHEAVLKVQGGTISPGGASLTLHVSRQFVHQLVDAGRLRAWVYLEKPNLLQRVVEGSSEKRVAYMEVAAADVVKYGLRSGRFKEYRDWPHPAMITEDLFRRLQAEVEQEPRERRRKNLTAVKE